LMPARARLDSPRAHGSPSPYMTKIEDDDRLAVTAHPVMTADGGATGRQLARPADGPSEPGSLPLVRSRATPNDDWMVSLRGQSRRVLHRCGHPVVKQLGPALVIAGLVISSLGSGVRWKQLMVDWLPLIAVLFGYGILRGYASHTFWGQRSYAHGPLCRLSTHLRCGSTRTSSVSTQRRSCSDGFTPRACTSGTISCGPAT